jgi:hypothetical protein
MAFDSASPIGEIEAADPSGARQRFEVAVEVESTIGARQWSYLVRPLEQPDDSGELYFAGVKEVQPGLVQLDATLNSLPESYRRCCITCRLVPLIARHLKSRVQSSRNPRSTGKAIEHVEETLSVAAEKVWKRMVREGIARYDPVVDRYVYEFVDGAVSS